MNEKIIFTAHELQEENQRCIDAQQERIKAILQKKAAEIRKEKFGAERDNIAFQVATNNQRINEALRCGELETIREIAETNRILLHNLDLYNAEEYSYTDTL